MPGSPMPGSPMPPTMAEREAELAALQTAFDDYIASSRELEDELDAELAKMRKCIFSDEFDIATTEFPFLLFRIFDHFTLKIKI